MIVLTYYSLSIWQLICLLNLHYSEANSIYIMTYEQYRKNYQQPPMDFILNMKPLTLFVHEVILIYFEPLWRNCHRDNNMMLTCWQLPATIQHNPHLTPNLVHLLAHSEGGLARKWQPQVLYCLVVLLKSVTAWIEYESNCCLESHDELLLLFLMKSASAEDWDRIWAILSKNEKWHLKA